MDLVTRAEFARRVGVTRQSVDRALKTNKLRLVGEGRTAKIDIHDTLANNYMKDNPSNRQVAKQDKDLGESSEDNPIETTTENDGHTESVEIRDNKIKLQTRKLEMEMAERLGILIERKTVERMFGKITESIISYLHPFGDRLSPILDGIYESTDTEKKREVKMAIDKEMARALEGVKRDIENSLLVQE